MSRKNRKGKRIPAGGLLICVLVVTAAAALVMTYGRREGEQEETEHAYAETQVRLGPVVSGVSESGTAEFGTKEQVFTVAEVTEVSSSSSVQEDTASDASAQSGTSAEQTGNASQTGTGGQAGAAGGAASGSTAQGSTAAGGAGTGNASGTDGGADQSGTAAGTGTMMTGSGSTSSEGNTSLEVEEVYAAAGQTVQEGDQILKITQESIENYREQLEAAVEDAQLAVSEEEINVESKRAEADYTYQMYLVQGESAEETYNATIASLENAVAELEEELEEADDEEEIEALEAELQIAENNLKTQSIEAKQTYENALTNYKYADQLYEIDTDGLEDDLNDAKDALETAEENLADFEEQIGDGVVYAEYAGTVTEIACAAGDTLSSDMTLVTYADPEEATMTVSVSQEDISQIAIGDETDITLSAYEDEVFPGEVTSITTSSSAGTSTVNYDVTVRFTGDTEKVYSGMTGEVTFAGRTTGEVLYIPNQAVHLDGTRQWVKVKAEDGTISEQEITTGFSNGTNVEVTSGLEEGQVVLIESQVVQ